MALHAFCRLADRASPLVQADRPDHQRPRDAHHRVVARLFAPSEPALRARHPPQGAADGGRARYQRGRLLYARAVQARHPLHRAGGHHTDLCRGDHRGGAVGAGRPDERRQGASTVGDRDLRPHRRRDDQAEPAMGRRQPAQARARAQRRQLRRAEARHHLWRRQYRYPAAPRFERDGQLQDRRLHRTRTPRSRARWCMG